MTYEGPRSVISHSTTKFESFEHVATEEKINSRVKLQTTVKKQNISSKLPVGYSPELDVINIDAINKKKSPVLQEHMEQSENFCSSTLASDYDSALVNWMNDDLSAYDDDGESASMPESGTSFHGSCDLSANPSSKFNFSVTSKEASLSLDSLANDRISGAYETNNSRENIKRKYASHESLDPFDTYDTYDVPLSDDDERNNSRSRENSSNNKTCLKGSVVIFSCPEVDQVPQASDEQHGSQQTENQVERMHRKLRKDRQVVRAEAADESYEKKIVPKSYEIKTLIYESIKTNMLFNRCSKDELLEIVDAFEPRQYDADEVIIQQGDEGNHLYVMEKGAIEVTIKEKFIRTLDFPGCVFGEIALLYNSPRTATIQAKEKCTLWSIHRSDYRGIIRQVNLKKTENKSEFLNKVKIGETVLGEALRPSEIYNIALATQTFSFQSGDVIVKEHDKGDRFFIIESGVVEVFKEGCGKMPITALHKSDFFGEKALICKSDVRTATCIASSEKVQCLVLFREDFQKMLGDGSGLIGRSWQRRFSETYARRESLGRTNSDNSKRTGEKETDVPTSWKHKIKLSDLEVLCTIGTGAFGQVKLVKLKRPNLDLNEVPPTFALKCQRKDFMRRKNFMNNVTRELEIMSSFDHPFIIKMYSKLEDDKNIYFLMEVLLGGEVFKLLQDNGRISEDWSKFYAASVVLAFSKIHEKRIAYRDLKPENLVMNSRGYAKIIDFGLAKRIENGKTWTLCGTPDYMAPEIILNEGHDWAVDCWALGIFLFEVVNGEPPFIADNPMDIYKEILSGHYRTPKLFSKDLNDLIRKLLSPHQATRLGRTIHGVDAIMNHPWFSNISFSTLLAQQYTAPFIPKIKNAEDTSNFDDYSTGDEEKFLDSEDERDSKWIEDEKTFKISGRTIVSCSKAPPLTFKKQSSKTEPRVTRGDISKPINLHKHSFLGAAWGNGVTIDKSSHSMVGFSLSRESSFQNMLDPDLQKCGSDSSSDISSLRTSKKLNEEMKNLVVLDNDKLYRNRKCEDQTVLIPLDRQKINNSSTTLQDEGKSKEFLDTEKHIKPELEEIILSESSDVHITDVESKQGQTNLFTKTTTDDISLHDASRRSETSRRSRFQRRSVAILNSVFRPQKKQVERSKPNFDNPCSALLSLHQEKQRHKTFTFKRHGLTGRIYKSLHETLIPVQLRINPIVSLECDYAGKKVSYINEIQTLNENSQIVHMNNDERNATSKISLDNSKGDKINHELQSLHQFKSSVNVSLLETRKQSEVLFLSSRNLKTKDERVCSSKLNYLGDLDEQFAHFNTIHSEAAETVKTIDSALSSMGVTSPFRKTEDIIPRFGELHMHLKSHLFQNTSYAISSLETKRKFQRRNAFVCHLQINSLIESSSSLDNNSFLAKEKNEHLDDMLFATSISKEVENKSNLNDEFSEEDETGHIECANKVIEAPNDQTDFMEKNNDSMATESKNKIHTSSQEKDRSSEDTCQDDQRLSFQVSGSSEVSIIPDAPHNEDIEIVSVFLGKMFGFVEDSTDLIIKTDSFRRNTNKDTTQGSKHIRSDCFEYLSYLANFMYFYSNSVRGEMSKDFLQPTSLCLSSGYKFEFLMKIFDQFGRDTNRKDSFPQKPDDFLSDTSESRQTVFESETFQNSIIKLTEHELEVVQGAIGRIFGDDKVQEPTESHLKERTRIIAKLKQFHSETRSNLSSSDELQQKNYKNTFQSSSYESLVSLFSLGWGHDSYTYERKESIVNLFQVFSNFTKGLKNKDTFDLETDPFKSNLSADIRYRTQANNFTFDEDGKNHLSAIHQSEAAHSKSIGNSDKKEVHHEAIRYSESDAVEFTVHLTDTEERTDINKHTYTVYIIEVEQSGRETYLIEHRYSEFDRLYLALMQGNVSMHSTFPKKRMKIKNINWRRAALNIWLIELTGHLAWGSIHGELREKCIDFLQHSDEHLIYGARNQLQRKVGGIQSTLMQLGIRNPPDSQLVVFDKESDDNLLEDWPSPPS